MGEFMGSIAGLSSAFLSNSPHLSALGPWEETMQTQCDHMKDYSLASAAIYPSVLGRVGEIKF